MSCNHKIVEVNGNLFESKSHSTQFTLKICEHCLQTRGDAIDRVITIYPLPNYPYSFANEQKIKRPASILDAINLLSRIYSEDIMVTNWSYSDVNDWDSMVRKALKLYILQS